MSQKDFNTMKGNVGTEVGDTSSSFATRIGVYVNNRMFDIVDRLRHHDLFEIYRSFTATTTAGIRDYSVPRDFDTPIYAFDETNQTQLAVITEREWMDRFFDTYFTTGSPTVIIMKADGNVRVQPTSSSTITAVSSSGSDTTQSIFVRGISGSAEFYETKTLNGTSSVATNNAYDYILELGKSASTTGKITITYTTGGETAAIISSESTEARYQRIGFHYKPSGSFDINIRYPRKVMPLVSTDEIPPIDISEGIELGAKADAWRTKRQFSFAADFETLYERWLDRYIFERQSSMINRTYPTPYPRDNYGQSFPGGYHY